MHSVIITDDRDEQSVEAQLDRNIVQKKKERMQEVKIESKYGCT